MKHFSGRRDGAPKESFKSRLRVVINDISIIIRFHQTAKIRGWYREAPNLFRYILGVNEVGDVLSKSEWLACLISSFFMPWVRRSFSNKATRTGLLDCLDAMKCLLIENGSGGNKRVKILITGDGNNEQ